MYADIDTPSCHRYMVFEEGRTMPLGLVVAVDTDKGYILYYTRKPNNNLIETVTMPNGDLVPRVFIRHGKFRVEER